MKNKRRSRIWMLGAFLGSYMLMSGCVAHVNLIEAPPYPTTGMRVLTPGGRALPSNLSTKLSQLSPTLWKGLSRVWGLQRAWGRLYLQLSFQQNALKQCTLRRSEIHAIPLEPNVQKAQEKLLSKEQSREPKGTHMHVCSMLLATPWPEYPDPEMLVVEVVLSQKSEG